MQARPNAVPFGNVLLSVAGANDDGKMQGSSSEAKLKRCCGESSCSASANVFSNSHEWHGEASDNTRPTYVGSMKSAMKHRESQFRTPSPTRAQLASHLNSELQSPFDDFDYIKGFLANSGSRQSVRFGDDCQHNNHIDVHLEDAETISVHVGYLQLDCTYSIEFMISAKLLLNLCNGIINQDGATTEVKESASESDLEFLRSWQYERSHGRQTKLVRMRVDEQAAALDFEFEFRAAKEKLVAQRFVLSRRLDNAQASSDETAKIEAAMSRMDVAAEPSAGRPNDSSDSKRLVNVVLVCRIVPRTKGTALLRDGVHLLNNAHRMRCDSHRSNSSHDELDTVTTALAAQN